MRVAFKLSQTGTGAVLALETTDSSYYFGVYEESGSLKLRVKQNAVYTSITTLTAVSANTWYVLELAVDDAAGFRATVWDENNAGTRYEARYEMPRATTWRFRAWNKSGSLYLDGTGSPNYYYTEEVPTLTGSDSRIVGKRYEYDSVSAQQTKRYYGAGRLLGTRTGTTLRYIQPDHLGSSSTLTDSNGYVVIKDRYSAFGERRQGESSAALITDQLYTAQRYNALSSLYHYSNSSGPGRFYDPVLGRFVQADRKTPDIHSAALNRYSYSFNNPIRYIDPNGETPWDIVDLFFWAMSVKDFAQNPTWANAGWLALDTLGLLPALPSTGWVRRGVQMTMHADNAGDIFKGLSKIEKTRLGSLAADLLKLATKPGAETLVRKLLSKADDTVRGARFELEYAVQHIDDVEEIGKSLEIIQGGNKEIDLVMKGNVFVNVKNYDWSKYNMFVLQQETEELVKQAKSFFKYNPSQVKYVFKESVPDSVREALERAGIIVEVFP